MHVHVFIDTHHMTYMCKSFTRCCQVSVYFVSFIATATPLSLAVKLTSMLTIPKHLRMKIRYTFNVHVLIALGSINI